MTDNKEFETIFRRHYCEMYRLALTMLASEAESKDVVSDVFAHLLDSGISLRSDTLRSFLLTSVRNRCLNVLAHSQVSQDFITGLALDANGEDTSLSSTLQPSVEQEQLEVLNRYVDGHLPELSQKILHLRYQKGLKYREIADALKISEVTVYNHLSQSLKLLKSHFKSLGYGTTVFIAVLILSGITYAAMHFVGNLADATLYENKPPASSAPRQHPHSGQSDHQQTIIFEDAELQTILKEIAAYHHCEVTYRNDDIRHIRLYFTWDKQITLHETVETFNQFRHIHITLKDSKLTVE